MRVTALRRSDGEKTEEAGGRKSWGTLKKVRWEGEREGGREGWRKGGKKIGVEKANDGHNVQEAHKC
jgi:hypothetical protein